MKVNKKILVYLGIGVYIILAAASGYILFGKMGEKAKVSDELAQATANLERTNPANLTIKKNELENQLIQVTSQTDTLKSLMSQDIANVAASTIVFEIAADTGVEITNLSSPSASEEILENVTCRAVSLDATIDGDVRDIVEFITRLNNYLTTGNIQSVSMTIPEVSGNVSPTATISLLIYNYQGE